jgi:PAS domain-containing protein
VAQKELEVILARQLTSYLSIPAFIVDPDGTLLFYNEAAEAVLGRRFGETGELALGEWANGFEQTDESGARLDPADQPLVVAVTRRRPAHRQFWFRGFDGMRRHVEVTGLPLIGTGGRYVGAIAYFWTLPDA